MEALVLTVEAINDELEEEPDESSRLRKLKEWVNRLRDALEGVARDIGASGFSISVTLPLRVGVSVTFDVGSKDRGPIGHAWR
jgi:hypothetical protein